MDRARKPSNVNVTQDSAMAGPTLQRNEFPCPLCHTALPVCMSKKDKPYCTCNECGIQLFFRGKVAIAKLSQRLEDESALCPTDQDDGSPQDHWFELETLKDELEEEKKTLSERSDVGNVLELIDAAIQMLDCELARSGFERMESE